MTDIEDRYYSMPEIMKYLGISRDTALRWITTKQMPAHKIEKKTGSSNFPKLMSGSIAGWQRNNSLWYMV